MTRVPLGLMAQRIRLSRIYEGPTEVPHGHCETHIKTTP